MHYEWWLGERSSFQMMLVHVWNGWRAARTKADRRQLRLLACGRCRLIWPHLSPNGRRAVEVAERFVDGAARAAGLAAARRRLEEQTLGWRGIRGVQGEGPLTAGFLAAVSAAAEAKIADEVMLGHHLPLAGYLGPPELETGLICDLVRDIFGNPFRPVAFDPNWRTPAAVALARTMYEARDFAHLPILADALDDAGCADPDIIAHCRGPGPHVRGCWVVDLVLDKG